MFAQLCRRLTFLRNKLLDDLREGGKIFVYKTIDPITDDEIRQLHRALRRYGNSTLLYVGLQTPAKSFPLVEVKEPGLLAGYIDRFNTATDGSQVGLPVTSGDAIARNAFRLWQGQRAAASEAGLSQGDAVVQVERDAGEPHVVGQIAAEAGDDVGHWVHTAFQARQDGRVEDARALLAAAAVRFPDSAHVRHDLARLEEAERNWPAAESAWRSYSALQPEVWWGHTQIAHALREQGNMAAADALVADLRERFPEEAGVFSEYARLAEWRGDWREARARWEVVAQRFPETPAGLVGQARALLMQGSRAPARPLLLEALSRFPAEADARVELARLEEMERNWTEAERCWREFAVLRPAVWWGPARAALALREQGRMADAEAVLAEALDRFPGEAGVFLDYARLAAVQRDWPAAERRWAAVTERFGANWEALAGEALALREQGRLDAARPLLIQAVTQFPAASVPLHDLARLHEVERNWPEAERRWSEFVVLDPSPWWAHAGVANALAEQSRQEEAEARLTGQFRHRAGEPAVFIAHAHLAERAGNWVEAEQRWSDVAARFPGVWEGFGGQVRSLRQQWRLKEADAVLTGVSVRFRGHSGLLQERAELAAAMGDWATAEGAWRDLIAVDPRFWWFYGKLMRCRCKQGRVEEAFATFADAKARFPRGLDIVIDFARTLIETGSAERAQGLIADTLTDAYQPTAQELLQLARLALGSESLELAIDIVHRLRLNPPGEPHLADNFGHVENALKARLAEHAPEKLYRLGEAGETLVGDGDPGAAAHAALMMRFESLGGDAPGCEIGLVQRKFGAEPLGLLRWTTIPPERLIEAMRCGFEGVGSPEQTELVVDDCDFYRTRDKRFDVNMLTFCKPSEIEFTKMEARALKRISFLREKLLRDLADPDKIFVYRTLGDTLSVDEIKQLKAAMNQYGRNRLLYLKLADEDHPVGSISIEARDLCFGYVAQFSYQPLTELHMSGWLPVFQQAASDWSVAAPVAEEAVVALAEAPALVVAEASALSLLQPEEPPAVVPVTQAPAKDNSWLRRAAGLFGSRARH